MKVLLVNGSPHERGCTNRALSEMVGVFDKRGVGSEILWIGKSPIAGCMACGACRTLGKCAINDIVNATAARLDDFDALVVGSPVYYAGPSGQICAFLDRLFFSGKDKLEGKLGASIVSCRRAGSTAAFDRLNKYFTISSMPVVSSNYWNQVHGNTPDEVAEDAEGLQIMRQLAENMTWLLRCIEAGRAAGVPEPAQETRVFTNFIRK